LLHEFPSVKRLHEPRKILLKQVDCLGVLMQRGNRMNAEGGATQGVIATDRTANGDESNRTASEGNTSNCAAPDCNEDSNGAAPKRKQADGQTADRGDGEAGDVGCSAMLGGSTQFTH
jgi:hypothetical protein